jgi:acetolactate synthase-1/2/3 large subunit
MKASDLFVKCLENENVDYMFGIPGEENVDLIDSLNNSGIKFILTRHEQGAAFMADIYGRITGRPGVCLSTLGPGATNLVTGVANAHLDKIPLVAITAQANTERIHKESHQNIDTIALFSGITKYNKAVLRASTIPEIVRKGFRIASLEVQGASHIQLPEDVGSEQVDAKPLKILRPPVEYASIDNIRSAAILINSAKNPLILAGNGIIRSNSIQAVSDFIHRTGIPVVNTFMAKGIIPFQDRLNMFSVGYRPYRDELRVLNKSDLVIAIGFDLVEYDPALWNRNSKIPVLNIHTYPTESDSHLPVTTEVIGDINYSVRNLSELVSPRKDIGIFEEIRKRRFVELTDYNRKGEDLPRKIMKVLTDELPPETWAISDVGMHKVWVSRWYQPKRGGRTIIYNGFASMGSSLPGAIACGIIRKNDPVVAISGDGGFLMNVQELETAKRMGVDITVTVFNDRTLTLISEEQKDKGLKPSNVYFTNPDFSMLANSFGATYHYSDSDSSYRDALKESIRSSGVNIIEIKM